MNKIYITSDLHFSHDREFIWRPRGFNSVYEMNEAIVKRAWEVMDAGDTLYILGDLMLKDDEMGLKLVNQLPGYKHIIYGNHDTDNRIAKYNERIANLQSAQWATRLNYNGYHFYLSHYPSITSNNDYDKPLKQRMLNLCGHSHVQDKWADWDKGYIYHVEVDCHNCFPICIDEIIEDFRYKTGDCRVNIDKLL